MTEVGWRVLCDPFSPVTMEESDTPERRAEAAAFKDAVLGVTRGKLRPGENLAPLAKVVAGLVLRSAGSEDEAKGLVMVAITDILRQYAQESGTEDRETLREIELALAKHLLVAVISLAKLAQLELVSRGPTASVDTASTGEAARGAIGSGPEVLRKTAELGDDGA